MKHQLPRTRSGRPSRSKAAKEWRAKHETYYPGETEREATATAKDARVRLYGVPPELAVLPEIGTLIGRMYVGNVVTREQFEAARTWLQVRGAMLKAIAAPGTPVEPRDGVGGGYPTGEAHEAAVRAATAKYDAIQSWLLDTLGHMSLYEEMREALDVFLLVEQHVPRLVPALMRALDRIDEWSREAKR